ncbi:hypothetical protein PHSY_006596 [Pseudozyma hubeiensis SY62]|uniref:Uncharacterized protein n=1 Tax=Pseudozyma hubeiensis (strain SY62) TaxID=1305764 RepID=R9PCB8_PSEHS|nr:hypothetical protein PHSY_006596 [Pseudozyma hubeiensis SY62]GAC98999.1 hypothetical protein PHSY_006596 [Pseudozyma hubeiensis SY62]
MRRNGRVEKIDANGSKSGTMVGSAVVFVVVVVASLSLLTYIGFCVVERLILESSGTRSQYPARGEAALRDPISGPRLEIGCLKGRNLGRATGISLCRKYRSALLDLSRKHYSLPCS